MVTAMGFVGSLREALRIGAERDTRPPAAAAWWLLGWALLCALGAVGLRLLGSEGYHTGFITLNALCAAAPSPLWEWLTVLGDERVALTLALLLSYRHPRVFWTLICAALVAIAYARGLKPLIDAARPPTVLPPGTFELIGDAHRRESFPSGHSVTAGVFFGVLAFYARRRSWRVFFLATAMAAGLSRVAVGVHWPVDVLAGLAGGGVAVVAGAALARRSPWGIYDEGVHLAFVVLAAFAAIGLFFDDGGYQGAGLPLQLLAGAALLLAVRQYLIRPLWGRLTIAG